jgi:hypothetical protein
MVCLPKGRQQWHEREVTPVPSRLPRLLGDEKSTGSLLSVPARLHSSLKVGFSVCIELKAGVFSRR